MALNLPFKGQLGMRFTDYRPMISMVWFGSTLSLGCCGWLVGRSVGHVDTYKREPQNI